MSAIWHLACVPHRVVPFIETGLRFEEDACSLCGTLRIPHIGCAACTHNLGALRVQRVQGSLQYVNAYTMQNATLFTSKRFPFVFCPCMTSRAIHRTGNPSHWFSNQRYAGDKVLRASDVPRATWLSYKTPSPSSELDTRGSRIVY